MTIDALPTAPVQSGYNFAGWNTQSNGSGTSFIASTRVSADITVHAQWALADFTITLYLDAGEGAFSQSSFTVYKSGGTAGQTVTLSGTGYTNPRWYVDANLAQSGNSISINAADYTAGGHFLTLKVNRNDAPWSKEIAFTVTN
jgi:uncharacterized repeat protein (TIGR02543 family)